VAIQRRTSAGRTTTASTALPQYSEGRKGPVAEDAGGGDHAALAGMNAIQGDLATVLAELVDAPGSGQHQGQLRAMCAVVTDELTDRQHHQCDLSE
jgi:hypothetical protein